MFILLLEYLQQISVVEKYLEAHRLYLDKYYKKGLFVCSGPQTPRTGGVIICKAENKEIVQQIIAEDPFYYEKIADYKIIEFSPTKSSKQFQDVFQNEVEG